MQVLSIQTFLTQAQEYIKKAEPANILGWSPDSHFDIDPLAQGEYNMNFLVRQRNTAWVLRINTGSTMGLSTRDQITYEFQTLILLAPTGVSPAPYFMDNSLRYLPFGVLGMAYLEGDSLDYQQDLANAARLMARYHQLAVSEKDNHLIREEQPLTSTYQHCRDMLQVYLESDLANPSLRAYLLEVIAWAKEARLQERYFQEDTWHTIVNTEVNNSNWIVNRKANTIHLVDWERSLWGDPSQDLSHFRVPTTTLWKTDYRMTKDDRAAMMRAYKKALSNPHLRDTIEERTRLRDPFSCLRGISWCAMAWIQYQQGNHLLKNPDTAAKLRLFVDLKFVRSLFDPFMMG